MARLAVLAFVALALVACTYAAPGGGAFVSSDKGTAAIITDGVHVASTVFPPGKGGSLVADGSGHSHGRAKRGSSAAAAASSSNGGSASAAASASSS